MYRPYRPARSTIASGNSPISIAIDPLGKFVYVANLNSRNITGYAISAITGGLTPVPGSPFVIAALAAPTSVTVDPSGKLLYATTGSGDSVTAYAISATTGALTPVSGSPFAVGAGPQQIIVSR
jgi:6-phosphogluconolactonase